MKKIENGEYTGERALYHIEKTLVNNCKFFDGESPIKECHDIDIINCHFDWKYPIWYSTNISINNTTLTSNARAAMWYINKLRINNLSCDAPKCIRRCDDVVITNSIFTNAPETLWYSKNIKINNTKIEGEYFCLNSENVEINNLDLTAKYSFDTCKHIILRNSHIKSRDVFWNCEDVKVYDSILDGEYLGWNSKNITFINCKISSLQGLCYMDNVKLVNCDLLDTNLCFELCSNIDADINSNIISVKNPISGKIKCKGIDELIFDSSDVDSNNTKIIISK